MARNLGVPCAENKPFYFISYNSKDEYKVSRYLKIMSDLQIPMWYDNGIKVGEAWEREISERIDNCEAVIMFISKNVLNKADSYVHKEYKLATEYSGKKIYVVMLDKVEHHEIPTPFRSWWIDVEKLQNVNAYEMFSMKDCVQKIIDDIGIQNHIDSPCIDSDGEGKKMDHILKRILPWIGCIFFAMVVGILIILYLHNYDVKNEVNFNPTKYPVVGVDVSNHQKNIDWLMLKNEGVDFAYIKATEGASYVDSYFEKNWEAALDVGLRVGAYHFFSFDSSGEKQASAFCKKVDAIENMLPPTVAVVNYGEYGNIENIDVEKAKIELRTFINMIKKKYGVKPVVMCGALYHVVIEGDFDDCDIWYSQEYMPTVDEKSGAIFWQYSNNYIWEGLTSGEKSVSLNVFLGTRKEFEKYPD